MTDTSNRAHMFVPVALEIVLAHVALRELMCIYILVMPHVEHLISLQSLVWGLYEVKLGCLNRHVFLKACIGKSGLLCLEMYLRSPLL